MKVINSLLLGGIVCLSLCSCAHKSGHQKNTRNSTDQQMVSSNSSNDAVAATTSRNLEVPVVNKRGEKSKLDGSKIFAKYNSAVFMIYTSDGSNMYQGSGFFINQDGLAVSNYHVFQGTSVGEEGIKMVGSNEIFKVVEVIHRSEDEDFILFRVNATNTNYIPLAQYKPVIGEKVYAIGSPRGLENTFSSGEVSQWRDKQLMQTSTQIDHGSSGGALINEFGEVVGITSGTFADGSQANLNYAWSIDVIKPYVTCSER